MKLLTIILILISLSAAGQGTTIQIGSGKIVLNATNRNGSQVGYFRFDSATGRFTRTGNQVTVFRSVMAYHRLLLRRLELAENVLQYIEPDGSIRYPIEFKTAFEAWKKENQ